MRGRPKQRLAFSDAEIAHYAPRMKPKFAAVISLANALSYEGIAAELNISIGTVKSRLSRARSELARLIDRDVAISNIKEGFDAGEGA
jgi:DNA-directed RNA polymerase specialized sigma24 family protein